MPFWIEPDETSQEAEDADEAALTLVTKVPTWVLENLFYPRGVRQTHRIPISSNMICGICLRSAEPKFRVIVDGKVFHRACEMARRANQGASWVDTSGVTPKGIPVFSKKDGEMIGNLGDAEYHLWVGSRLVDNDIAMCRCCRKWMKGEAARALHKLDTTSFMSGYPCYKAITEACKMILPKNRCIVCKKEPITDTRYGVHLCSWVCVNTWKFSQEINFLDFRCAIYNIRSARLEKERAAVIATHEKNQFN